jgi:hypothetical protein
MTKTPPERSRRISFRQDKVMDWIGNGWGEE